MVNCIWYMPRTPEGFIVFFKSHLTKVLTFVMPFTVCNNLLNLQPSSWALRTSYLKSILSLQTLV